MKRLGRILGGLLAVALTVASLQAAAAERMAGRDFNHMATGFPLSGGHATAPCETCHAGGVFKGTPRNCEGCHAVGKRVLATPKSNAHIVTDAPCETCHFNTSTWLGARYNHGTAIPGQCTTCHNGRLSMNKPSSHNTGNKATKSCDNCHRSSSWLPASWNHAAAAGICSSCHVSSPEVTAPNRKPAGHAATRLKNTLECDSCHSYIAWYPNRYKHNTAAVCSSCHNGVDAIGPTSNHSGFVGWPMECNECHTSTFAWLPALGAKPADHIPYNAGVRCSSCHVGGGVVRGPTLHTYLSGYACTTCHESGNAFVRWGQETKSRGHENWSTGDCSQSGCHRPAGSRGTSYINWN
jgi:hypothetical protein